MIDDPAADSPHSAEQDENYFVSMTDMMVGILFVFIILLMVFALNFRTHTDISDQQLARLEAAAKQADTVGSRLEDLQQQVKAGIDSIDAATKVRAEMLEEIKTRLEAMGLPVQIDQTNGVLRLTDAAIRFDVESAELTPPARANVAKVATVLSQVLPTYSAGGGAAVHVDTVFIEGHTDRTGDDAMNWQLSTNRAVNTYRAMTEFAANLRQLHNDAGKEILSVSGYSSTRPVPDIAPEQYDLQRRIDLRFVMEVDERERLSALQSLTGSMQDQLTLLQQAVDRARVD